MKKQDTSNLVKMVFPKNISLKNKGDFVEGIFQGCQVKVGEGLQGSDLILGFFKQEDDSFHTAVLGAQAVKFVKQFKTGFYLKIIKLETGKSKKNLPFAQYEFEYDSNGLTQSGFNLVSGEAIPEMKKPE